MTGWWVGAHRAGSLLQVLLNKSVSLTRGQGYVQMDINMHRYHLPPTAYRSGHARQAGLTNDGHGWLWFIRFGYPARKGLHFLNERFKVRPQAPTTTTAIDATPPPRCLVWQTATAARCLLS